MKKLIRDVFSLKNILSVCVYYGLYQMIQPGQYDGSSVLVAWFALIILYMLTVMCLDYLHPEELR